MTHNVSDSSTNSNQQSVAFPWWRERVEPCVALMSSPPDDISEAEQRLQNQLFDWEIAEKDAFLDEMTTRARRLEAAAGRRVTMAALERFHADGVGEPGSTA